MRATHLVVILILLALVVPASPAFAGGVVSVCDEAHLLAALAGGGTVTFSCNGTITLTAEITIATDTTIDGSAQTVTISGNHAVRVFTVNEGVTLNLNRLIVANGAVSGYESGGGIYNDRGTVTVSNSTFFGNSAYNSGGGGIANAGGTVTVSNSTFSGNSASGSGSGGGIVNDGTLTVSNSTFAGNDAREGGSIWNHGALTASNSTFSGNSSTGWGGAILNLSNYSGWTVTVSNCTFASNSASYGGGIYTFGTVTVSNSTFAGNDAGEGGGIYNFQSTVTVSNSTFAGNSATSGGGIYNYHGGRLTLKNTIVSSSPNGSNCAGTITDGGGNLSYLDTTCPGINADPVLGPLQNNGGFTETMALSEGSAAIDAGIDTTCGADPVNGLDQRGVTRPQGPHCDIGAYERQVFGLWFPFARAR